jgi:hypothetical protein
MYILPNPLFRLSDIPSWTKDSSFYGEPWISKENDRIVLFSRGQWALKELGSSIIRSRNRARGIILIPEYFCEISLTPLRTHEFEIHFYRITPGLEPDITDLDRISRTHGPPDMMLFVHYFGIPLNIDAAKIWCMENNVVLVEDAAHSLLSVPGIGDHGCPVIYTPWKFLNIPDGALLVLPEESGISMPARNNNSDCSYPLQWVANQIFYSAVRGMRLPLHKFKGIRVKGCDESEPPTDPGKPECRPMSAAILSEKGRSIAVICRMRERNYRKIDEAVGNSDIQIHRVFSHLPASFAPYVYPLRIKGGQCRKIMVALNRIGIPAMPWSDLSPEVKNSEEYPLANALRKDVMVLPVHQDISLKQIDWMIEKVQRIISEK